MKSGAAGVGPFVPGGAGGALATIRESASKTKMGYEKIGYQEGEAFDAFNEASTVLHDLNNPFGCDLSVRQYEWLIT